MAPRKTSPAPAAPTSGMGPINWHGTRPEIEAVLKMREGDLKELLKARDGSKGFTNTLLDSNICNLEIMVDGLKRQLSSIK